MATEKRRHYDGPPPSQEFTSALQSGGGTQVTCSWCDREHYAIDNNSMTGRWDDLQEGDEVFDGGRIEVMQLAKEDPDGYVLHYDCDAVYYSEMDSQVFPDECPCNGLRKYENFFWANRQVFKKYMDNMTVKLAKDMESIANINLPKSNYK
jgi:hypothetical protein